MREKAGSDICDELHDTNSEHEKVQASGFHASVLLSPVVAPKDVEFFFP